MTPEVKIEGSTVVIVIGKDRLELDLWSARALELALGDARHKLQAPR